MMFKILNAEPGEFAWVCPCSVTSRKTHKFTLPKKFANGIGLRRGLILNCYYERTEDKRPVVRIYLDGEERGFRKGLKAIWWWVSVEVDRGIFKLRLDRDIAKQTGLKQSQPLYCYQIEERGRGVLEIFLDKKPRQVGDVS